MQQMGPNDPEVQIRYVLDITKQYNNICKKKRREKLKLIYLTVKYPE